MFQDMENKIRSTLNEIYFGKTKDIVNGLRYSYMSCLDNLNHHLSFLQHGRHQHLQQLCFSSCTILIVCWVTLPLCLHLLTCHTPFVSILSFLILFEPTFAAHVFSFILSLLFLSLSSTSPVNLIFIGFFSTFLLPFLSMSIPLSPLLPRCLSSVLQIYWVFAW